MKKLELKGGKDVAIKSSSTKFSLNNRDFLLGLLMAFGTPIIIQLYDILMAWLSYEPVTIEWRTLIKSGIGAGALYLGKNFFDKGKIVIDQKALDEAKGFMLPMD